MRCAYLPLLLLTATGCAAAAVPADPPPASSPTATSPTGSALPPVPPPTTPVGTLPAAPWSRPGPGWASVPRAYRTAWEAAENRTTCAALAPAAAPTPSATPRTAYFSGGWAVAYDLPEMRSAFGVAGTGASATGELFNDFPHRIDWSDGSIARYGPEGGNGPNQLAYLTIPGQSCLYNVWSRVGLEHLEQLLASLRFVE